MNSKWMQIKNMLYERKLFGAEYNSMKNLASF